MDDQFTRRRFTYAIGMLTITGLAGCSSEAEDDGDSASGGSSDDSDESTAEPEDESTPTESEGSDVEILEHELVEDDVSIAVEGKLKNTSGEEQSYMGVEAKFFNADDERVGEGLDNATDVAADTVVNFECILLETDVEVDHYEIEASTSSF